MSADGRDESFFLVSIQEKRGRKELYNHRQHLICFIVVNKTEAREILKKLLKKLPKRTFKMKIHNLLFLNLQNQDSYADIDNLIYEIKKTPS